MRIKIAVGLVVFAACLRWTETGQAQTAVPAPTLRLPSGESVRNLNGDWDVSIENYGPKATDGNYTNVYRIAQTGASFSAIRLRDNPPPSVAKMGSTSLRGEMDQNGFKRLEIVTGQGVVYPSKGRFSEDGRKIDIDNGSVVRLTLTRK